MATLNVSNVGQTGLNWNISGLSSAWTTANYVSAVIATSPVSDGQTAAPTGVLGSQSPPSSGTNTFTPTVGLTVTPDTHYGLFGAVKTPAANQWFQAGSATFWTYPQSPSSLTGLTATGNNASVHLIWNTSSNATSYDISWSGGSSNSTNPFTDIGGLTNGTFYTFTVTPKNSNATSGLTSFGGSASASATPNYPTPSSLAGTVSASATGQTTATVSWGTSTNATSYQISNNVNGNLTIDPSNIHSDTVTGLTAGTTYVFTVTPYDNGVPGGSGSAAPVTTSPPAPPTPSSAVSASRIDGGFNLSWGSSSGATSYTLDYKYSSDPGWTTVTGIGSTSYSISGRNYGTNHDFRVLAHNASGDSAYTSTTSAYTAPQTPSITEGVGSSTSINIIGNVGSNTWDWINVERYDSTGNTLQETRQIQANGGSVTFTGLTNGTTYKFKAKTQLTANASTFFSINYSNIITTIAGGSRPSNFAWTVAKISGGTLIPGGVTALEWNGFTSRINDFRSYKSLGTTSFTSVTAGVTDISAAIYNEARTAISAMSPPTPLPSAPTSGATTIAASHFNGIRDSLNSIP